jgi:protein phosphatase
MRQGSATAGADQASPLTTMAGDRPWRSNLVGYTISAVGRTDRGQRRADNQDCILFETSEDGGTGLYAVADGMGGQRAGEVASAIAVETLREHLLPLLSADAPPASDLPLTEQVRLAINACNERILRYAEEHPEAQGLGSTLTLALVKGSLAIIGNIGDSRTYRVRDGQLESITRDHSLVAHLVAHGEIAPEEVYSHPHRSYIYRALGSELECQPDINTERLQSGDALLLCSDGLWEMVRDDDIARAVSEATSPDNAATTLVQRANDNGGEDNISAIVVKVQ